MRTKKTIAYECGVCGRIHLWAWEGACQDNFFRTRKELAKTLKISESDIEIRDYFDKIADVSKRKNVLGRGKHAKG